MPRQVVPIALDEQERNQLVSLAQSRSLPHGLVRRAQIVLACADGEAGTVIAQRLKLNKNTVFKWRKRYIEHGLEGLHDETAAGTAAQPRRRTGGPKSSIRRCSHHR